MLNSNSKTIQKYTNLFPQKRFNTELVCTSLVLSNFLMVIKSLLKSVWLIIYEIIILSSNIVGFILNNMILLYAALRCQWPFLDPIFITNNSAAANRKVMYPFGTPFMYAVLKSKVCRKFQQYTITDKLCK